MLLINIQPLPSIFRSHSAHSSKENTEGGTDSADLPSETKPSTNFSAFRTLMTSKGRKNSDGSDAREAVYAARPMTKGGRRYSCMVQHINIYLNIYILNDGGIVAKLIIWFIYNYSTAFLIFLAPRTQNSQPREKHPM